MSEVLAKEYPNVCLRVMYRRRSPPTVDRKALFAIIVPPAVHRLEPARAAPLCADLRWRDADTQQCSSVIDGPKRGRRFPVPKARPAVAFTAGDISLSPGTIGEHCQTSATTASADAGSQDPAKDTAPQLRRRVS